MKVLITLLILLGLGLGLWAQPAQAAATGGNSAAETLVLDAPIAIIFEQAPKAFSVWSRGELVSTDAATQSLKGLSRTNFFKFVDDIDIRLSPISDTQTELSITSVGRVGEYDFGGNQRNIDEYLATLNTLLNQA